MSETENTESPSRNRCDHSTFIEACLNREDYPTKTEAIEATGLAAASFAQRLAATRKEYPEFDALFVPYPVKRKLTQEAMSDLLSKYQTSE